MLGYYQLPEIFHLSLIFQIALSPLQRPLQRVAPYHVSKFFSTPYNLPTHATTLATIFPHMLLALYHGMHSTSAIVFRGSYLELLSRLDSQQPHFVHNIPIPIFSSSSATWNYQPDVHSDIVMACDQTVSAHNCTQQLPHIIFLLQYLFLAYFHQNAAWNLPRLLFECFKHLFSAYSCRNTLESRLWLPAILMESAKLPPIPEVDK